MRNLFAPLALLGLIFSIDFTSTFFRKQLWSEGAQWVFHIAQNQAFFIPPTSVFHRQTTALWQIPSVLASLWTDELSLIVWLFCLGYMIFPYVGLAVVGWVSYRKERPAFFFLSLMAFFLTIMPGSIFSVSVVNESIMVFGFLLAAIVLYEKPSVILVGICAFWLAFNYELSVIFNITGLIILWREKKITRPSGILLSLVIILQLYFIAAFVLPASAQKTYLNSFAGAFFNIYFLNFVLGVLVLGHCRFKPQWTKFLLPVLAGLVITEVIYIQLMGKFFYWATSFTMRTWAIPAAGVLYFLGIEGHRNSGWQLEKRETLLLTLLFVPITFTQITVLADQKTFLTELRSYIEENPGCRMISKQDYLKLTQNRLHPDWSVHFESVLVQDSFETKGVLFPQAIVSAGAGNEFCKVGRDRKQMIHYDEWTYVYDMGGRFKFPYVE